MAEVIGRSSNSTWTVGLNVLVPMDPVVSTSDATMFSLEATVGIPQGKSCVTIPSGKFERQAKPALVEMSKSNCRMNMSRNWVSVDTTLVLVADSLRITN